MENSNTLDTDQENLLIECSYKHKKLDKNMYPLFIRFRPENKIIIKLDPSRVEGRFADFIKILHNMFEGLEILEITYPKTKTEIENNATLDK